MEQNIHLIITDDHALFRQGLISLLKEYPEIKVVGQAANGEELLKLLNKKKADIILLDIQMPVMNGRRTLEHIKERFPDLKIMLVSMDFSTSLLEEYIIKGINGFIPKGCDIDTLLQAIYLIKKEGNCFALSRTILHKQEHPFINNFGLTEREITVIGLACQGKSNKEIGKLLSIKERTVEFHKTNIYTKTGFKNPADLISYGVKNGLDLL
jgi:DNA-binding NarL/FixJ family response regulator